MKLAPFVLVFLFSLCALTCKKEPPVVPPISGPDTTSHNFTFMQYTFGGNGGSSYFKDVAIVNDTLAYAVGQIFALDSLGQSGTYGIAIWNGVNWKLKQLNYSTAGNTLTLSNIRGIQYISSSVIWFAAGSIFLWDGVSSQAQLIFSRLTLPDPNATIEKLWGNNNNIYGVGNAGTIVHYDGSSWAQLSSGTTIDLRDVYGAADGNEVWACGYSNDNSQSILLNYDGSNWKTVWNVANGRQPFGDVVTSLWVNKNLYSSSNIGIYAQPITGSNTAKQTLALNHFPYQIRGSADNNIVVVGDFAMVWHYNGSTWELLNETNPNQPVYSAAVSTNLIIGVGGDYSSFPGNALIYFGRRTSQ